MKPYKIIVVGGGPAGMMAALRSAQLTDSVALFEKNASLARKLGLTGMGRCNITNSASLPEFLESFGKNGPFLRDAFNKFSVDQLISFFQERGLRFKAERQGRVFPAAGTSKSVIDILKKALAQSRVEVHLSFPVKSIIVDKDRVRGISLKDGREFRSPRVILAAGGASYPETGSTGDGFHMAGALGHSIEELRPGLVPLETEERFVKELQGLTLKNIKIVFYAGGRHIESDVGELLFTHFGVSGPLVLDLSADITHKLKNEKACRMTVDLKPGLHVQQVDLKLQRDFAHRGSLMAKNYLAGLLPKRLVDVFLTLSKIEPQKKCHQVTSTERKRIVENLKKFPLTVKRARPLSEAMVTVGGVSLKEVDPKTMASKKVQGLYFCGEVLDIAGKSGGFNLQVAFSTGYTAGEAAALS